MLNFDKALARLAAHTLRRRLRRDQSRMPGLKLLQFVHKTIEFRIADLGIVEHVIAVLVMTNLLAKRLDRFLRVLRDGFHLKINSQRRYGFPDDNIETITIIQV